MSIGCCLQYVSCVVLGNAPSGTIIDRDIVASRQRHNEVGTNYDFYLIGQSHMLRGKPVPGKNE